MDNVDVSGPDWVLITLELQKAVSRTWQTAARDRSARSATLQTTASPSMHLSRILRIQVPPRRPICPRVAFPA